MAETKSLLAKNSIWSNPEAQLEHLESGIFDHELPKFMEKLNEAGWNKLTPSRLEIFQVNIGKMCNQVCQHCHVDAGPDRKEIMTQETMQLILNAIPASGAHTLDLTGGAPEMHPHFRWFVEQALLTGVKDVIVRCNLTIILANKKYHDLPEFFAANNIHVVSSLPFYKKDKTDKQRGDGVFEKSIEALKMLNRVGYGMPNTGLKLDLVYNPAGAFLPAAQSALESEFKKSLMEEYGVSFNQLFTITNIPISRFLDYLIASDNYEDYMDLLVSSFNASAISGVMCRNTLSVGWDGQLFDCDFNQMLELPLSTKGKHIADFSVEDWNKREIVVSQHCYGCTAGAGSSCQGATV